MPWRVPLAIGAAALPLLVMPDGARTLSVPLDPVRYPAGWDAVAVVLERSQEFVAQRFAGQAPLVDPSWREVAHRLGENGLPIVAGAVAWIECRVTSRHDGGDHDIVVGAVTAVGRGMGEPLVHWERGYWGLSKA